MTDNNKQDGDVSVPQDKLLDRLEKFLGEQESQLKKHRRNYFSTLTDALASDSAAGNDTVLQKEMVFLTTLLAWLEEQRKSG